MQYFFLVESQGQPHYIEGNLFHPTQEPPDLLTLLSLPPTLIKAKVGKGNQAPHITTKSGVQTCTVLWLISCHQICLGTKGRDKHKLYPQV